MKKNIIMLGIVLISLLILNIEPSYGALEENSIHPNILNKDLLNYIKANHMTNIEQLCSQNFCSYLKSINIKKAIEIFEKEYQEYITREKGSEEAISAMTKGFPITEILVKEVYNPE